MVSERKEYLQEEGLAGNKSNDYRPGRTHGHGQILTFRIPRDRYGNFHPLHTGQANEKSVILFMGKRTKGEKSYQPQVSGIDT